MHALTCERGCGAEKARESHLRKGPDLRSLQSHAMPALPLARALLCLITRQNRYGRPDDAESAQETSHETPEGM